MMRKAPQKKNLAWPPVMSLHHHHHHHHHRKETVTHQCQLVNCLIAPLIMNHHLAHMNHLEMKT